MSRREDELHEPDEQGSTVDQENADIAAGPATAAGDTAVGAMGATGGPDARPGHPAEAPSTPVSAGEAISRGRTPAGPTSPSTGTLGNPDRDADEPPERAHEE